MEPIRHRRAFEARYRTHIEQTSVVNSLNAFVPDIAWHSFDIGRLAFWRHFHSTLASSIIRIGKSFEIGTRGYNQCEIAACPSPLRENGLAHPSSTLLEASKHKVESADIMEESIYNH
ncbi:hypothetical protein M378DRAFT_967616 [Amanita muscaria Koide BX008]|uniref:Uncharacterized protein n=1 Tax=Amanita muscaria (strain Koide BX008) TaxID=946122 RepID=A0A0C2T070_AMAMK|nr:hypothetical protein M378DRAFT_967616 [Amanita muscaria Koide BX008]